MPAHVVSSNIFSNKSSAVAEMATIWPQQRWAEKWRLLRPFPFGNWVPI